MRKIPFQCLLLCMVLFSGRLLAQTNPDSNAFVQTIGDSSSLHHITPGGWLDTIYDQNGHAYRLTDLAIPDNLRTNKGPNPQPLIQCNCNSGYFQLWMEPGCGIDDNTQVDLDRRNVVCQVLRDLSNFIPSPLTATGQKVNVLFRNFNLLGAPPGAIGLATSFYIVPPTNYGIADNTCWTTIHSGVDAYAGITTPLYTSGGLYPSNIFFHCLMSFNFSQPWHTDLATAPNSTEADYYSTVLHEMCHALGISANINYNGSSLVGNHNPFIKHQYYSRYDRFLKTQPATGYPSGQQLIQQDTGVCGSMYGYLWNTSLDTLLTLSPHCVGGSSPFDTSVCSTAIDYSGTYTMPVYTPGCFFLGSSLSHFEDYCQVPASFSPQPPFSNNRYYVMSNASGNGPQFMKRYLKPEERAVLCDLGYPVATQYGDSANLTYHNYGGSACDGIKVAGVNDGIQLTGPSAGTYNNVYTTAALMPNGDTLQNILANDYCATPANLRFECLQPVNAGQGYLNVSSGNGSTIVRYTPTANFGSAHLLRYVPYDTVTGKRGNITYVYVWVNNPNCNMMGCVTEMINNPEFTADTCSSPYYDGVPSGLGLNCWSQYATSPDLFYSFCTSNPSKNIPVQISSFGPTVIYPYSPGNTNFLGLYSQQATGTGLYTLEAMQTTLASPLMPGQSYQISFWAKASDHPYKVNYTTVKIGYSTQTLPEILNPTSLVTPPAAIQNLPISNAYGDVHLLAAFDSSGETSWVPYTYTFTFPGTVPAYNLIITSGIMDNTLNETSLLTPYLKVPLYFMIDGIHLIPSTYAASFMLPDTTICMNQTIPDLSVFVYPQSTTGVFSGAGVSYSNGVYSYSSSTVGAGYHTISYTYTDANGCTHILAQPLKVIGSNPNFLASGSDSLCPGSVANLHAQGATSYHWYPTGTFCDTCANTYLPSIIATTTFTVVGMDSNCASINTVTVHVGTPNPPTVNPATYVYCQNAMAIPLAANASVSGALLHWYNVPVGGTPLGGAPTPSTAITGVYHWYVSQNLNGCESIRDTITVTIMPSPLTPTPITPITYCQGATTVPLNPNGTGYHWYLSNTATTPLPATPLPSSANAGTTTWYVSAVYGGCESGRAAVTVIINPTPTKPIVAGTITYCAGTLSVPLTPSGTGIQWYNSLNQPITTPTPGTTPAGTTVYHVTQTVSGCTSQPAYDTIIVNPLVSLNAIAANWDPCFGSVDTLTATMSPPVPGVDFVWSATTIGGAGSATINCVNPPLCSQVATSQPDGTAIIYTVTASNGCSISASVTLKNQACSACDICDAELDDNYLSNNGYVVPAGQVFCVHNDLTIYGTLDMYASELKLSPNVTITVASGAQLNIHGTWIHACDAMWDGIVVEDGGQITTDVYTSGHTVIYPLIEDAYTAISYDGTFGGDTSTHIYVKKTTFNRNNVGVSISNYNELFYHFSIQGSIFTSRDLDDSTNGAAWAQTPDVLAMNNPTTNELQTPYVNDNTYAVTTMKPPMDAEMPVAGVELENVGFSTWHSVIPPGPLPAPQLYADLYYSAQIGQNGQSTGQPNNYNVFDWLHNGVLAHNTNFICRNNIFQHSVNTYVYYDPTNPDSDYDVYAGLGIGANGDKGKTAFYRAEVSSYSSTDGSFGNHFYDIPLSIYTNGYNDEVISHSTIRTDRTAPVFYGYWGGTPFSGQTGIRIINLKFHNVTIDHNQLYNMAQGILYATSASGYQNGTVNVSSNCIAPNLYGASITNRYCADAMLIASSGTASKTSAAFGNVTINNNTITNVYRGIHLQTWLKKDAYVRSNYVKLVASPIYPQQFGISFDANTARTNSSRIESNLAAGVNGTKDTLMAGIVSSMSTGYYVGFNNVQQNYHNLQFMGANSSVSVKNNVIGIGHFGLTLGGSASPGTIGTQGNHDTTYDNRWTTGSGLFRKTALISYSNASGNEFYVRSSGGIYNPTGSCAYVPGPGIKPYSSGITPPTLIYTTPLNAIATATYSPDGSECGTETQPPINIDTTIHTKVTDLEALALGTNLSSDDPDSLAHLQVQQLDLYKRLQVEPDWLDSSTVLYDFYVQMNAGYAGDMGTIEDMLASQDTTDAITALDDFNPSDAIGDRYKQYYTLYLKWLRGDWENSDAETIFEMGMGCPYKDGTVVYYARSFYSQVTGLAPVFVDNCGFDLQGLSERRHLSTLTAAIVEKVSIYPNPTTGLVSITLPKGGNWQVSVSDVQGRDVNVEHVRSEETLMTLKLNTAPGIYLVHVVNTTTGSTQVFKLTVQN